MTKKIAIVFGAGGEVFDPANGEAVLTTRCKGIGLDVGASPYNYTDSQAIYEFLKDADWAGVVGDSFGADYAVDYARSLSPKKVDFIGGFQPSVYASNIETDDPDGIPYVVVPKNVIHARCFRDPLWIQTLGLGYATWKAEDKKATDLKVLEHYNAHPDDWGYTQNIMFADIQYFLEHP